MEAQDSSPEKRFRVSFALEVRYPCLTAVLGDEGLTFVGPEPLEESSPLPSGLEKKPLLLFPPSSGGDDFTVVFFFLFVLFSYVSSNRKESCRDHAAQWITWLGGR